MAGGPEKSRDTPHLFWAAASVSSIPVLLVLRSALFGGNFLSILLGIPLLLLAWGFVGIASLVLAVRYLLAYHWAKATGATALAGVVILGGFNLKSVVFATDNIGAGVNLVVFGRWYRAHLPPMSNEPRLAIFDRGGLVTGGVAMVYDESDEIVLPPERQSKAFKARAENSELACGYSAAPLWGHYYDAWISC